MAVLPFVTWRTLPMLICSMWLCRRVWELVQINYGATRGADPRVLADMKSRDNLGRERYGTPLQAHNGRNALLDAYEEALDLTVYLRQAMEELHATSEAVAELPPLLKWFQICDVYLRVLSTLTTLLLLSRSG